MLTVFVVPYYSLPVILPFYNYPSSFLFNLGPLNLYDCIVEVRNRFKGLDLIDRVSDELWNEVRDIVQEPGIKNIPQKKKFKKGKWLSEEAQIAEKRRDVKGKREKERYTHLNAVFQRIARRDKKPSSAINAKK